MLHSEIIIFKTQNQVWQKTNIVRFEFDLTSDDTDAVNNNLMYVL